MFPGTFSVTSVCVQVGWVGTCGREFRNEWIMLPCLPLWPRPFGFSVFRACQSEWDSVFRVLGGKRKRLEERLSWESWWVGGWVLGFVFVLAWATLEYMCLQRRRADNEWEALIDESWDSQPTGGRRLLKHAILQSQTRLLTSVGNC